MKTNILRLSLFFITLLFLTDIICLSQNSTVLPLIEKKKFLSQSIDSLDLLKQSNKRSGLPFTEIELKQAEILDSLKFLRNKIQTEISIFPEPFKAQHNKTSLFKPLNFFDWILLTAGTVALFSGILLLYGIIKKMFVSERNKFTETLPKATSVSNENSSKSISTVYSAAPKSISNNSDDFKLYKPKAQLEHETLKCKNTPENSISVNSTTDAKTDLESNILKAALNGMNIHEISRQFHLSSDHVTLILRLSQTQKNGNNLSE